MGFQDWKWIGETEYFQQSENKSYNGEYSLRIGGGRDEHTENMAVLKQSIDDAPTEPQLETRFNPTPYTSFGMVFRWQDDDNFYAVDSVAFTDQNTNGDDMGLYKRTDGSGTNVRRINLQNTPPSDREWNQFRCKVTMSEGDLHVRPEFRDSADNWIRYNEDQDLIDPEPSLEGGGGAGMVFYNASNVDDYSNTIYLDQTRIYYDQ